MYKKSYAFIFITFFYSFNLIAQSISTFAGSGTYGYLDGNVNIAQFAGPEQLAVDNEDNIYVADRENHVIRKISPNGEVTTYAGTGIEGDVGGNRLSAQFSFPIGVCYDKINEYLYVIDEGSDKIKRIDTIGNVVNITGNGYGYQDGSLEEALFAGPIYMCIDKNGNLYTADSSGDVIRKIDLQEEQVSTIGGNYFVPEGYQDGPALESLFNMPRGIAVDDKLNVYVGDQGNNAIRKITPEGMVSTIAGGGAPGYQDGPGEIALFNGPKGVSVDSIGNIYVADRLNFVVRKIDTLSNVSTITGEAGLSGYTDGTLDDGLIGRAVYLLPLDNDRLLVSDWGNDVIRLINLLPIVSSKDINNKVNVKVYPNPSNQIFTFKSELGINKFKIYDSQMQVVRTDNIQNSNEIQVDLYNQPSGIYFILLYHGSETSQLQFIKS